MKYFVVILIFIGIIGCDNQQDKSPEPTIKPVVIPQKQDSKWERLRVGTKEYAKLSKSRYATDSVFNFASAKVYEIHCPGECHVRSLFTKRTGKTKTISKETFKGMMEIIADPTSYDFGSAACFHPSAAIITYDAEENPIAYFGICLDCNTYNTNISLDFNEVYDEKYDSYHYKSGFSKIGRKHIRSVFRAIDFEYPYGGYASMFDDLEDVKQEMKDLGLDSLEIEKRILDAGYESK